MIVLEKSSDSRHKLDGSTDERLYRREQAIGFTLKNPVAARILDRLRSPGRDRLVEGLLRDRSYAPPHRSLKKKQPES